MPTASSRSQRRHASTHFHATRKDLCTPPSKTCVRKAWSSQAPTFAGHSPGEFSALAAVVDILSPFSLADITFYCRPMKPALTSLALLLRDVGLGTSCLPQWQDLTEDSPPSLPHMVMSAGGVAVWAPMAAMSAPMPLTTECHLTSDSNLSLYHASSTNKPHSHEPLLSCLYFPCQVPLCTACSPVPLLDGMWR